MNGRRESGLTRRELLKRSAIAGTAAVWVTPVIESLVAPAGATGHGPTTTTTSTTTTPSRATCLPGSPFTQDISFVALLVACPAPPTGTLKRYRIKWNVNDSGSLQTECGTTFSVAQCTDQLKGYTSLGSLLNTCPPVTPYFDIRTGHLTIDLGTGPYACTLYDFVVKCGVKSFDSEGRGCQDPNEVLHGPPSLPATGRVTFWPCNTMDPKLPPC